MGEDTYIYDIGAGNTPAIADGETVERFDILATGVTLKDYYTHEADIIALADATEEPRLVIELTSTATGYTPDDDIISKVKNVSVPAGLILKS